MFLFNGIRPTNISETVTGVDRSYSSRNTEVSDVYTTVASFQMSHSLTGLKNTAPEALEIVGLERGQTDDDMYCSSTNWIFPY